MGASSVGIVSRKNGDQANIHGSGEPWSTGSLSRRKAMALLLTLSSAFGVPVAALALLVVHRTMPQRRTAGLLSGRELEHLLLPSSLPPKRGWLELHCAFSALLQAGSRRTEDVGRRHINENDCPIILYVVKHNPAIGTARCHRAFADPCRAQRLRSGQPHNQ